MSDQTLDTRVESLLREALKAEAASLPLRVSSDQVLDRARVRGGTRAGSRQALPRLSMAFAAGAAAVVIAIAGAVGLNFVNQQGLGGPVASPTAQPALTAPPFGLAGNGVIALAKDGDIFVADRPGGDTRPLVTGPELDSQPTFSSDGTRLAFLRDTGQGSFLMVADPDGTNVVAIPLESRVEYWSFAPDGRSLMVVGSIDGEERVFIRPVDPRAAPTVLDVQLLNPSMLLSWAIPTFNPVNPQEILVVGQLEPDGPRGLYVFDLATGAIRTIVEPADERYVQDIAWLPDGEHIIYRVDLEPRVVAADGSGDRAFDALRGRFSPFSNDGTRIVAERDGEGEQTARPVIVPINGDGEPVVLACGPGADIECPSPPTDWIWSPDNSMLIGTVYHESSDARLTETYLLVDANTGQVTELDWVDVGTPAWQRVAPQSPIPALLARGNFVVPASGAVELEATGEGSIVTGRMTVSKGGLFFTVDLQCARTTEDGLIMIGGVTTVSTARYASPEGSWAGIVLGRGSPVEAGVWSQRGGASGAASCPAFLDEQLTWDLSTHPDGDWLDPIEGTVELGP